MPLRVEVYTGSYSYAANRGLVVKQPARGKYQVCTHVTYGCRECRSNNKRCFIQMCLNFGTFVIVLPGEMPGPLL